MTTPTQPRRRGTGPDLWRLSGRARDQRGHGGGSGAAGSLRDTPCDHPPDRRARSGSGARRVPARRARRPGRGLPLRDRPRDEGRPTWSSAARGRPRCRSWRRRARPRSWCRCRPRPTTTSGKNAEVVARAGAAVVIEERELTGERLADGDCWRWSATRSGAARMAAAARTLARPDAAARIADRVEQLALTGSSRVAPCWVRRGASTSSASAGSA